MTIEVTATQAAPRPCHLCFRATSFRYEPLQVAVCEECAQTADPNDVTLVAAKGSDPVGQAD